LSRENFLVGWDLSGIFAFFEHLIVEKVKKIQSYMDWAGYYGIKKMGWPCSQ
jgi:hypothetical protein